MLIKPISGEALSVIQEFEGYDYVNDLKSDNDLLGERSRDLFVVEYHDIPQDVYNGVNGLTNRINNARGVCTIVQIDKHIIQNSHMDFIRVPGFKQTVVVTKYVYRGLIDGDPSLNPAILETAVLNLQYATCSGYSEREDDTYIDSASTIYEYLTNSESHVVIIDSDKFRLPIGNPITGDIKPIEFVKQLDSKDSDYIQFNNHQLYHGSDIITSYTNVHVSRQPENRKLRSYKDSMMRSDFMIYASYVPNLLVTTFLTSFISDITFKWNGMTKVLDIIEIKPSFGIHYNVIKMKHDLINVTNMITKVCIKINDVFPNVNIFTSWSEYGIIVKFIDNISPEPIDELYTFTQHDIFESLLMGGEPENNLYLM